MLKKILLFLFMFFLTYNVSLASSYIYFYGQGCSHCAKVADYMDKNDILEKFDIEKKEVYYDNINREIFSEYGNKLGISENDLGVPFMVSIDDNNYYKGDKNIINHFKGLIENNSTINNDTSKVEPEKENTKQSKSFFSFLLILLPAALADSINPCVFAVMLILLGSILNRYKSYKKMIFSGSLFILSIFISYFLMGLGIYKALAYTSSIFYLKMGVGILGLLVGLANLKDYFWYGKGFVMEVPKSWRPKMKYFLNKITSPIGAFFIGFIVSLFLLPCTSGPYFTILGYLASESDSINMMGYIYLLIYNIIFILPMVVIIILVALGTKTVGELKEYKEYYTREIHLAVGILMLLLSFYIFYDLLF